MRDAAVALAIDQASAQGTSPAAYLDLLFRVKQALDSGQEVAVPAADIARYPEQPRKHFDDNGIRLLSRSIDTGGQTTSALIRRQRGDRRFYMVDSGSKLELLSQPGSASYELIDGERRWRSTLLIPVERRPLYKAKLIEADDEVVRFLISGIANFNRVGHTALEVSETVHTYLGFGFPMKEIAVLLGISEMWAREMHSLRNLGPEVRAMLDPKLKRKHQLPIQAAIQISKIEQRFQLEIAQKVMDRKVPLSRLRAEVIKVAKREGSHIRLRDVSPAKKWESFGRKADMVGRVVAEVADKLQRGGIERIIRAHPQETAATLRSLRQAREQIYRIEEMILRVQKERD